MSSNRASGNSRRHPHPPTPQTARQQQAAADGRGGTSAGSSMALSDASFAQANIDLERLWNRVINSTRMSSNTDDPLLGARAQYIGRQPAGSQPASASRARRSQPRARVDTQSSSNNNSSGQSTGWIAVNPGGWEQLVAADTAGAVRPRSRRRLSSSGRGQPGTFTLASSISPPLVSRYARPVPRLSPLPPLPGVTGRMSIYAGNGDDHEEEDDDEFDSDEIQGPTLRIDPDDIDEDIGSFHSSDEDEDEDEGEEDMEHIGWDEYGMPIGVLGNPISGGPEMLISNMNSATLRALGANLSAANARRARATASLSRRGASSRPQASLIVRQAWNKERAWKPHIYQEPVPNINLGVVPNAYQRERQFNMPGAWTDTSRQFSVNPAIHVLDFDCTNADDMGRGSLNNLFAADKSMFVTTRAANVNLELAFIPDQGSAHTRHCVVERILIQSPLARPPCTELMVFASSRRCSFSELARYDDYTFAKYEKLAKRIERLGNNASLDDPLPIAYFWLSEEEGYKQLQCLPQGKACKYVYVKMLRGQVPGQPMSLRLIRIFGWQGPRSFSEAAIC
ncbi:hypothetical protein GQ54DRAFT_295347 [Martensiomyces pterosporus]|nr:hypothetical protein GQ54DRAFT_295347 [Martensiomyces pterosporus]